MRRSLSIILVLLLISCQEENAIKGDGFLRVLDDRDIDVSYNPIGITETADGNFMLLTQQHLSGQTFPLATVFMLDDQGNFVSSNSLDTDLGEPIGKLMQIGVNNYFFAMRSADYQCFLATIDEQGIITTDEIAGLTFPLAASVINDQFILQTYDAVNFNTVLSIVNENGTVSNSASYTIGAGNDAQQLILDHFFEEGRELPFFTGITASGSYYFNGIYNFTFSLVFSDLGAAPSGVLQGQGDFGGLSSFLSINTSSSALVGFQYADNFYQSNSNVSETAISSSINYFDSDIQELSIKANSALDIITIGGTNYLILGSETESRQVVIYFIDLSTNLLKAVEYVGYVNPYSFSDLNVTADNDLLITGSFYANGRFERPFVKKFASEELVQIVERN